MILLLITLLMCFPAGCCDDNVWRGIRPLKTDRQTVEQMLGKPTKDSVSPYAARYKTDDGDVSMTYSRGTCETETNSGWNVPEFTVVQITFYPKARTVFSDLRLDRKKYEEISDYEILHVVEFLNVDDGISITVDKDDDLVKSIRYFPTQHDKILLCKK